MIYLQTRGWESLGLLSPQDFPRAAPSGNPLGKANPGSHNLLLEVYTILYRNTLLAHDSFVIFFSDLICNWQIYELISEKSKVFLFYFD